MRLPIISTDMNKSDQLDVLADFISMDRDEYGQGMENLALAYLNREKALQGRCCFFDPAYVNGSISKLNRELAGQHSSTLLTSAINVYEDEALSPSRAHYDLFKNTLNAISHTDKDFDKIFIPIGCQEEGKPGHNIGVVLEKDRVGYKATIIDQMGGASYTDTKAKIIQDLWDNGVVNVDYNRYPISENRNDCATFTSLFAEFACDGEDMRSLIKGTDRYYSNHGVSQLPFSNIDQQHKEDQDLLVDSADRLAEQLIVEAYQVDRIDRLRGLSDIPEPRDIVCARVRKMMNARNVVNVSDRGFYER